MKEDFKQELEAFLEEWFNEEATLLVHTSGSTGTPKEMRVEKERMKASAGLTCSFLGLRAGDSALLCMPLKYIAGKMVVVRALVADLDLWTVEPSGLATSSSCMWWWASASSRALPRVEEN